jgi:signal peptidase II
MKQILLRNLFWIAMVLGCALDQFTKWLIVSNMTIGQSIPIIDKVFHLTYVTNTGAAFSILQGQIEVFTIITVIMLVIIIRMVHQISKERRLDLIAFGLFAGGTLGNFIDRIFRHSVVDFLDCRIFDFPIFNVADSLLTIAVGYFIIKLFFVDKMKTKPVAEIKPELKSDE